MTRKLLRRIIITVGMVAVVVAVWFGLAIHHHLAQTVPDAYAVWWVADMVNIYMDDHAGKWPRNWDDLRCLMTPPRSADMFSAMQVIDTALPEVKILRPAKHGDDRGFFSETFSAKALAAAGLCSEFVQDNQSLSVHAGVVRGLHYQLPPMAQDKLVRVIRGAIIDVAVDIRRGSPNFGRHVAVELSAENWQQLLVPKGFAHGFATLVPNTEVFYKVTAFYSPQHDRGIRWNDPALGIDWKIDLEKAVLSAKDQKTPLLAQAVDLF